MKNFVIVSILCLTSMAFSREIPETMNASNTLKQVPVRLNLTKLRGTAQKGPFWKGLQGMSQEQRENAEIHLQLAKNASERTIQMAGQIEELWNTGKFEDALALCPELEQSTSDRPIAVLNAWRTPIPAPAPSLWGNDIMVSSRDSVWRVALDIHRGSGNLFAITRYIGDGMSDNWSMNISKDGGETWAETFRIYPMSGYFGDVDISVVGDYCHIGYSIGDVAYVSRVQVANGTPASYSNGKWWYNVFTGTDTLKEVCLTSNHDWYDDRLYYLGLSKDGNLRYFYNVPSADTTFHEIPTGVTNAREGLDATYNKIVSGNYYLFASYYTVDDSLHIDAVDQYDTWHHIRSYPSFHDSWYSSISAFKDTVVCFHEYHENKWEVRYWITYNGGTDWLWSFVDDTTAHSFCPDVTLRSGDGIGVVYLHTDSASLEGHYTHRVYPRHSAWDAPVMYTGHTPAVWQPSIEYMGGNTYGTLYSSMEVPYHAYFDRTDWVTKVEDFTKNDLIPESFSLSQNFPNPFNPVTEIRYGLPEQSRVTLEIYNALGQKVATIVDGTKPAGFQTARWDASLFPSGIYFYQLKARGFTTTKKMILLK